MKRILILFCALTIGGLAMAQTRADAPRSHSEGATAPTDAELRIRILAFLDRSIGWQNLDKMEVESISAPDAHGLRIATVKLTKGTQHAEGSYYITSDGGEIIEGTASKLTSDPWADTRAKLDLRGAPSTGAADAPVTIVEYSDLECPYCKEEATSLEQLMINDPGKVRLVFKYFPLEDIHPWSLQAAEAAVCVTAQDPSQFWNFEKSVFDAQEQITTETAKQRLRDFALESGAKPAQFDACIASPATKAKVDASIANGHSVGVNSTPTLFINGRIIPSAQPEQQLQMLVDHEAKIVTSEGTHQSGGLVTSGQMSGKQCGECKPLPPIKHP